MPTRPGKLTIPTRPGGKMSVPTRPGEKMTVSTRPGGKLRVPARPGGKKISGPPIPPREETIVESRERAAASRGHDETEYRREKAKALGLDTPRSGARPAAVKRPAAGNSATQRPAKTSDQLQKSG